MVSKRHLDASLGEDELLAGLVAGELSALAEIYRRHGAAVLSVARKMVTDAVVAETATAEVFVELWDHDGASPLGDLRTYLTARVVAVIDEKR